MGIRLVSATIWPFDSSPWPPNALFKLKRKSRGQCMLFKRLAVLAYLMRSCQKTQRPVSNHSTDALECPLSFHVGVYLIE